MNALELRRSKNFIHLDLVRGLAAVAVCVSHIRAFVLLDRSDLGEHGILTKLVYAATGLGHQAVIVFFVLSGVMITHSVMEQRKSESLSWRRYLLDRAARLWTVLAPCLLATLIFDLVGLTVNPTFYDGRMIEQYHSGPSPTTPLSLDAKTFLANMFFLQGTPLAPVYGSNGPLWSLMNEAWYYILFPLCFIPFIQKVDRKIAVLLIAAAAVICFVLPAQAVAMWPIWLAGFGVTVAYAIPPVREFFSSPWCLFPTLIMLAAGLGASRALQGTSLELAGDYVLACACVACFLSLMTLPAGTRTVTRISKWLSRISYSLYLSHFPLLAAVSAVVLDNKRFVLDFSSLALLLALFVVSLCWACLIYILFEKHTPRVRRWLERSAGLVETAGARWLPMRM